MSFLRREPLSLYHIAILLCLWFRLIRHVDCQTIPSSNISCIDRERRALITFKKSLVLDSKHNLPNWNPENMDCCRWEGIRCNKARHVVAMDLRCPFDAVEDDYLSCIGGEISSSLLQLYYLNYLDLSNNYFTRIPEFVGSFKSLRYFNLSNNPLTGKFPYQLGNISVLKTLDFGSLSRNSLQVDSLIWVSKLTSLEYLDLSYTSLESTKDWVQSISSLPSLKMLYLQSTNLPIPPPIQTNASTSLVVADFSDSRYLNPIDLSLLLNGSTKLVDLSIPYLGRPSPIPDYLLKLVSIKYLDLSSNYFEEIPETFSNLSNLITLDVSRNMLNKSVGFLQSGSNSLQELRVNYNQMQGALPNLSKFPYLQVLSLAGNEFKGGLVQLLQQSKNLISLDVSSNHFSGPLTGFPFSKLSTLQVLNLAGNEFAGSLAQLLQHSSNLIKLDVSSNHFSGTLTEAHFRNFTNLKFLSLSYNSLTLNFSIGFSPPFQLKTLGLSECNLGKIFPHWLRTQLNLSSLEISNSGISDTFPSWFWGISPQLRFLNISHNSMGGSLPPNPFPSCDFVDLSFNRFNGSLPSFSRKLFLLDVSKNSLSGDITALCGQKISLLYVDLSTNFLSGILPSCFESFRNTLMYLDISNNFLSGILPEFFGSFMSLNCLNLDNNKFTGSLPNSIGNLSNLEVLRLRNNDFSGNLPGSLQRCRRLYLLDFGENNFSGTIPDWMGKSLTTIVFLRLSSNSFEGNIPSSLCHLNSLHILDLSFNNLSGTIPSCFNNITSMKNKSSEGSFGIYFSVSYNAWVFWKGLQIEYKNAKGMKVLRYIDLSSNILSGLIPEELTNLAALIVLNLSHNVLVGPIPNKIGQLRILETLDLSHNLISEKLPSSMSDMSTLNYLDLSYNNLMGRIPVSTQLSTIDVTMFEGNSGLCGAPLPNSCHQGENVNNDFPNTEGGDDNENMPMYISIVLGFIVGFWGVCGTLMVKHFWAQKYFQFLTHIQETLHVIILIGFARLRRRSRN